MDFGFLFTNVLGARLKSGLSMLLYAKVARMTSFSLKSAQMGKVTNLISNDLGNFVLQISNMAVIPPIPLMLIGSAIVLVLRIGWAGLLGVLVIVMMIPLSNIISQWNGGVRQEINHFKDQRINVTSETIEGIKYVKLYGWELAFRKLIQDIRHEEISGFKKLAFGKALERAVSNGMVFVSCLCMFFVASLEGKLTYTKIFSCLEVMLSLKFYILYGAIGLGIAYDFKVVLGRFASIFNFKNRPMIKLNRPGRRTQESKMFGLQRGDVRFCHFDGFWQEEGEGQPALRDIHAHLTTGRLYGITGKVGSGKSSILGAILGEMPCYSGDLDIQGSVALI
jgi:ATP-binding cassette, subfamily C (CFTR/MRP), member 4